MITRLSPDMLSKWAKAIAVEIDPIREPLAPMILEAYMQGGRERKQLFKSIASPGGVLPEGGAPLLPYAFLALGWIANGLIHFYKSGGLSALTDILSCWKNLLEIVKGRNEPNKRNSTPERHGEALISLRRMMEEIQHTLENQGLRKEQCELISYRVMKVLLQEPAEAAQFIKTFHVKLGG